MSPDPPTADDREVDTGTDTDADADGADRGRARRVAVTGTPGTGKTTATERLAEDEDADVVHLNDLIREEELWTERDAERDSVVADLDAVAERLGDRAGVIESHLAHCLDADRVVVLRCRPDELETRLRDRDGAAETGPSASREARENAESEALDVILSEAVDRHGADSVYEIETTDAHPDAVADAIREVIAGERDPAVGTVDYVEYL